MGGRGPGADPLGTGRYGDRMQPDSLPGRAVQWMASTRAFRAVGPRVFPPFDRFVHRVTRGRVAVSNLLVPVLMLHAVGARSGLPRDTLLATLPEEGGSWLVVGSNYGKDRHPGWTANLLAEPDVAVTFRGERVPVRAELLDAERKDEVWERLTAVWPLYDGYESMSGRDLRVFRLHRR